MGRLPQRAATAVRTEIRLRGASMWNCPKCDESLDDTFAVCWQCGTDHNGQEDPDFCAAAENGTTVKKLEETEPPLRWQIGLWILLLLIPWTALIVGLIRGTPDVVGLALVGIIIANLLGLIFGLFVTCVLRFPNDGSLMKDGVGWASSWAAQLKASDAENGGMTDVEVPLCLQCVHPVSPLDHYCPHCGQSVGQLTPYLPYEGIWFNAGMWGKLWDRLWYKNVE